MKGIRGDYTRRRQLAAEGRTTLQAARVLGIRPASLSLWAKRNGVAFADGRKTAAFADMMRVRVAELQARGKCNGPGRLAYPERHAAVAEGLTIAEAALRLGVAVRALQAWARSRGVRFRPAKSGPRPAGVASVALPMPRRRASRGDDAGKAARPLSADWFAARLTEAERADYRLLRGKGGFTALEALASIRRTDLVAEVTAHLHARAAAPADTQRTAA